MAFWPFKRNEADAQAENLLLAVVAASRQPGLYGEGRAPDTLEGRFEVMTLHGALALIRLRGEPQAQGLAQRFTDKLFRHFDSGLREAAVGDLAVPKKMRRLAGDFYGRLEAYAVPLAAGDKPALEGAIVRNLLGGVEADDAGALANYAAALSAQLAGAPVDRIAAPESWRLQSI